MFRTDFPYRLRCFPRGLAGPASGTRTMSVYVRFAKTRERRGGGIIRKICNDRMSYRHLIKRHVGALRQTGLPEPPICRFNVLRTLPLQISHMFHHSVRSNSWPKRPTQPYRPSGPNRSHRESPERRCGKMVRKCTVARAAGYGIIETVRQT